MSWLKPSPPKKPPTDRPWRAPSLAEAGVDIDGLSYVVVEEIVGRIAGLSLSPWPHADDDGRLRFPTEKEPTEISLDVEEFCKFLNESFAERPGFIKFVRPHRRPERPDERQLRIGTTFAVEVRKPGTHWTKPLEEWIERIYDISADAREVARLASYGALTEHWSEEKAEDLAMAPEEAPPE